MPQDAQLVPPLDDVVEPLLLLVVVPLDDEDDVEPLDELLEDELDEEALLPLDDEDDVEGAR